MCDVIAGAGHQDQSARKHPVLANTFYKYLQLAKDPEECSHTTATASSM